MQSQDVRYRAFAIGLIKSLGFAGAVDCARRNGWRNVLATLLGLGPGCDCDRPAA